MSKRNKNRNVKTEEIVEEKVIDMPEPEETETKEEDEVKEKKSFAYKVGSAAGKVVGGAVKVVTSKPAKIIGGIALVGGLIAAGYEAGKNGIPSFKDDDSDDFTEDNFETETEDQTDTSDDAVTEETEE